MLLVKNWDQTPIKWVWQKSKIWNAMHMCRHFSNVDIQISRSLQSKTLYIDFSTRYFLSFFVFATNDWRSTILQLLFQVFVHGECYSLTWSYTHYSWCDTFIEGVKTFLFEHVFCNSCNSTQPSLQVVLVSFVISSWLYQLVHLTVGPWLRKRDRWWLSDMMAVVNSNILVATSAESLWIRCMQWNLLLD